MMIASSLTSAFVTVTYSAPLRLSCRSIDHWLLPSLYKPVISKLSAAISVPVAPLSRLRVVGRPRPKGRSQAESAATTTAPTNPARARYDACDRERIANKAWGVTGRAFQSLLKGERQAPGGEPLRQG